MKRGSTNLARLVSTDFILENFNINFIKIKNKAIPVTLEAYRIVRY
jgi:hypothetical protein